MPESPEKQLLRKQLRTARICASNQFSDQALASLTQQLTKLRVYKTAKNIAVYLPFKSEFPTQTIIQSNFEMGKKTYVPKITSTRSSKMRFIELNNETTKRFLSKKNTNQLAKNKLGIEEPKHSNKVLRPQSLDIIFMPLLGFDIDGGRLGMGGGYYDRALSFKPALQYIRKPYLIGLAYEAQQLKKIQTEPWDVFLDGVITEENFYSIHPSLR